MCVDVTTGPLPYVNGGAVLSFYPFVLRVFTVAVSFFTPFYLTPVHDSKPSDTKILDSGPNENSDLTLSFLSSVLTETPEMNRRCDFTESGSLVEEKRRRSINLPLSPSQILYVIPGSTPGPCPTWF